MDQKLMLCYYCSINLTPSDTVHHGLHETCFMKWFELPKTSDFDQVVVKNNASQLDSGLFSKTNASFFVGMFKKYSAELGDHSYILKVRMDEYPELPMAEYLCNQLARDLGLHVPEYYLINFNGIPTFASRNFVSKKRAENLVHIYRYLPKEENSFNCETIIGVIEKETKHPADVKRFIDICLFDALIGNHDRHGRNLAILETSSGKSLAPFYDNPSNLGSEDEKLLAAKLSPRGKIATNHTNEPTLRDYVQEFKRLHHEEAIRHFFERVDMKNVIKRIDESFIGEARKSAFKRLINERYDEMVHELN